jgi:hypothetical protein
MAESRQPSGHQHQIDGEYDVGDLRYGFFRHIGLIAKHFP